MSGVRWDLAAQSPDYYGSAMRGFEDGMRRRAQLETQRAMAALQGGPNPEAMRALYTYNPQLAMQMENQMMRRAEFERGGQSRDAMAAALLGGNTPEPMALPPAQGPDGSVSGAAVAPMMGGQRAVPPAPAGSVANPALQGSDAMPPMQAGGGYYQQQQPRRSRYSEAEERLIRTDPDAFLTFQGKRLEVTAKQFKNMTDVHGMAMQLVGGVHDQATYDAAKQSAANLYTSYGFEAGEFLAGLPAEYSPETVKMLQLQGMDTSKQLAAIARENNIESQIEVREQRAGEYERHNRAMENRPRSQPRRAAPKAPTPTGVIGRIMDKQSRGEKLTPAEQRTYDEYRAGRGGKGGGKGSPRRNDLMGPIQTNKATGQQIQWSKSANGWVDLATGKKVN